MKMGGVTRETVAHGPTRTHTDKHGREYAGPTTEGERGHVQSAIRGAERLPGRAQNPSPLGIFEAAHHEPFGSPVDDENGPDQKPRDSPVSLLRRSLGTVL